MYDFLTLFETALHRRWFSESRKSTTVPANVNNDDNKNSNINNSNQQILAAFEIVVKSSEQATTYVNLEDFERPLPSIPEFISKSLEAHGLVIARRKAGHNTIAMVAWVVWLLTPEYPDKGRWIMLVANDVTISNGTFGVPEGDLFSAVTRWVCVCVYLIPFSAWNFFKFH